MRAAPYSESWNEVAGGVINKLGQMCTSEETQKQPVTLTRHAKWISVVVSHWNLNYLISLANLINSVGLWTGPCTQQAGKDPREADYSRLGGGIFNKQKNLQTKLVLGGHKMSISLYPPARILKIYVKVFTEFSHIYHLDSLKNTLFSQGCVFGTAPTLEMVGTMYIPMTEEEARGLWLPRSN